MHQQTKLDRENREGFAQAERTPPVLAQFEKRLSLLTGGGNGREECCLLATGFPACLFETGGGRQSALDFHVRRERRIDFGELSVHPLFQLTIAFLQDID